MVGCDSCQIESSDAILKLGYLKVGEIEVALFLVCVVAVKTGGFEDGENIVIVGDLFRSGYRGQKGNAQYQSAGGQWGGMNGVPHQSVIEDEFLGIENGPEDVLQDLQLRGFLDKRPDGDVIEN